MLVFKFGGASVRDADSVRNAGTILKRYKEPLAVVVSAMGKTTNAMEEVTELYVNKDKSLADKFRQVRDYHMQIVEQLFPDKGDMVYGRMEELFGELDSRLQKEPSLNYDYDYDQIVCYGELISTSIISAYLNGAGIENKWVDIRGCLKTDDTYREGKVDWELSAKLIPEKMNFKKDRIYLTQGFLASTINNQATTLGREGSDYTAAILAYILKAKNVIIWKDVPGVMNADPKWFDNTIRLKELSYLDAIELAFYGASVIHPKTIKPLQNKNIDLYVKSFLDPDHEGTRVGNMKYEKLIPSFIFKMDQVLIRISPLDFSFITEDNLEIIFGTLHKHGVKINLMQNSAVNFVICINNHKRRFRALTDELEQQFRVTYETGLELITIRYYDQETIDRVMINKELILEQITKQNIQLVVRDRG